MNIQSDLMAFFARNLWRKLWEATGLRIHDSNDSSNLSEDECSIETCDPEGRLSTLDSDGDGIVTPEDIQHALRDFLGLSISEDETTLADYVYSFADTTGDGTVTTEDFEIFCTEMPQEYKNQKWRLAFPKPVAPEPEMEKASQ